MKTTKATPKRRRVTVREQLGIERARLRVFRQLLRALPSEIGRAPAPAAPERPDRIVQLVAVQRGSVQRGYASILHALTAGGRVLERHVVLDQATKQVTDEWWAPIGLKIMESSDETPGAHP